MFIVDLIKAFKGDYKKEEEVTLKPVVVDINQLPKESQDWIRRCYNKKNGLNENNREA